MKKIAFITLIVMALVLVGCKQSYVKRNLGLEESIYSIVEDINNSEISINPLTDFNWDKAFLFEPYTPKEQMEGKLAVKFDDPSKIGIRDDIYLLVFLDGDKPVQYVEIDRQKNSFSIGEKMYLRPNNDLITIVRQ